ncbi:MAG TPA: threonine/serine dehydratase [Bacteroidota bacterium]|jgi:threonine dehydratase|nr:threonine/serine dehydratase [Bacteroidota bacterium]
MISFQDIETAYSTIKPVVHKTPLLSSRAFNEMNGNEVYFKAENFQRVGAFKFRGAYNKVSCLSAGEKKRGVIAHSSGNHAQGVALAAKLFGIRATVVMPHNSVGSKVAATQGYDAEVVFCDASIDARERTTDELIKKFGYVLIHPYNDEQLIAGQGTATIEIHQELKELDYLFVPIGGGGLISGCAIAAKNLFPGIAVIGVETEGADDCYRSFRAGRIIKLDAPNTIADGMRTNSVGPVNFEIIRKYVDDVITIKDDHIFPMMKFFLERMKILVEPTGAVAPAAVMTNAKKLSGKRICAVISGGNVDPELLKKIL